MKPLVPYIPEVSREAVLRLARRLNTIIPKDTPQHLWPLALLLPLTDRLEVLEAEAARLRRDMAKMKAEGGHFKAPTKRKA